LYLFGNDHFFWYLVTLQAVVGVMAAGIKTKFISLVTQEVQGCTWIILKADQAEN